MQIGNWKPASELGLGPSNRVVVRVLDDIEGICEAADVVFAPVEVVDTIEVAVLVATAEVLKIDKGGLPLCGKSANAVHSSGISISCFLAWSHAFRYARMKAILLPSSPHCVKRQWA